MPFKMSTLVLLAMSLFIFGGTSRAATPGDTANQIVAEDESLLQGWLMWGKGNEAKRKKEEDDKNKEKKVKEMPSKPEKHAKQADGTFSDSDRLRIQEYYKNKNARDKKKKRKDKKVPPGLQKKLARGGELPPGWQAKVQRGEVLDAELLSHSSPLPVDLRRTLPAQKDGIIARRIGDKIIRVLEGNGTVLDVIDVADIVLNH